MAVIGTRIPTDLFSYRGKVFCSFASDLMQFNFLSQLYDDACDEGFVLVSAKTGKGIEVYLSDIERDADGDTVAWKFRPVKSYAPFYGVTIFND